MLNQGILPAGYYALPLVDRNGPNIEVQILADDGGPHLTAAVEVLSPRNKERPAARRTFAMKCVDYLRRGSSVVVVDTTRTTDLTGDILSLLGANGTTAPASASLSTVSYRAVAGEQNSQQLQVWPATLALGQPLPTLPLWIAADFSVPLDLDASYQITCTDLRVREVG